MTDNREWCRLKPEETYYLEQNNISFNDYVHSCFTKSIHLKKIHLIERISNRLLLVFLGLSLFALSYITPTIFPKAILLLIGFFSTTFGSLGIIMEVKHG